MWNTEPNPRTRVADKQTVGTNFIATVVLGELSRRGMTVVELQRRTGVHRLKIGRWLSGSRPIRSNDLERILNALHITIVTAPPALPDNGRRSAADRRSHGNQTTPQRTRPY